MNCRNVNNLLSAYMDGELAGVEHIQVQHHLRDCPCCQEDYESLLCTKRLLAGLGMKPPRPDLEEQILRRVGVENQATHPLFDLGGWWSVLTERQRQRVRMSVLCSVMCAASLALATTRITRSLQPVGDPRLQAMAPQPGRPGSLASYTAQPPADYLQAYSSWNDAQSVGPGPRVMPVTSSEQTDAFGPPPGGLRP